MTEEELEREYYDRRPTEPYSEDDNPNDLANIVQYAEENLGKAFKAIAELEKEKCELLGIIQGKDKVIQELEKENAELKEQCSILADCNTCYSPCKNENVEIKKQLTKAKGIIKDLLYCLPKESIEGVFEVTEEAEQFISE